MSDEALVFAGRLLADLGAHVVRVEALGGDCIRTRPPFLDGEPGLERSLAHILYNAGKRSLALNFASPGAWDVLDRLLASADIVIAPLEKSAFLRRLLNSDRLASVRPQVGLVDVVFRRGREDLTSSDLAATAAGGLLYSLGYPDRAPDYPAGKLAFKQASLIATAVAATIALEKRTRGRASHACISLQEAVMSTTIQIGNQNLWAWDGQKAERRGQSFGTLQAADGRWVSFGITPVDANRWRAFATWLAEGAGFDKLVGTEYLEAVYAPEYGGDVHQAMARLCASMPRDELAREGQARGLLVVPVNTADDIATDDHLGERGCFPEVEHRALGRSIALLRSPFRSSAFEPAPRRAPLLGEHSEAVLRDIGYYNQQQIEALIQLGLISGSRNRASAASNSSAGTGGVPAPPATIRSKPGATTLRDQLRRNGPPARAHLPLHGYRVLDFCWMAAGPLVTELLANLGADVIKLESSARVDAVRTAVHPTRNATIDTGAFFQDCNTDKRSITLNLGTPAGIELAKELVRSADVVTENFTPGLMSRWGLGHQELGALRPGLVIASFPVMGSTGPKASWRGIGNSVVAMCGLAGHTGQPDRPPAGVTLHTDFTLAPIGAAAIIAALHQRENTGEGQHIEIAQYEAAIHLLDTELIERLANGVAPARGGNRSREMAPHGVFPCAGKDRWVALAARNTVEWHEVCRVIGRSDLIGREDLLTLEGRKAAEEELERAIAAWSATIDAWAAADALQSHGVPASPLEDVQDLVENDAAMRDFFHRFVHPAGLDFLAQNQPFLWNGTRLPIQRAPLLGEHNKEVFQAELGIDEERFIQLMVERIIY